MRDLSKKGKKSIIDLDEFLPKYAQSALTHLVHPIEKQKSDKLNTITPVVRALQLELNEKPLPESYHNWPSGRWFNTKIRVDNIPASAAAYWFCGIGSFFERIEIYFENQSNGYAFLTFDDHHCARGFVEKFKNRQIPGTDMVYQLSWAPFHRSLSSFSLEKDEGPRQSDPLASRAHKIIESSQVSAGMVRKILDFHQTFQNEIFDKCKGSSYFWAFEDRGVLHGVDDGRTTILCLTMVDPCFEESAVKFIFGQYGKCTVDVPNNEGCGFVKYEDRDCAEQAYVDLENLFEDGNVCCLRWGVDRKARLAAELMTKGDRPFDLESQRRKAFVKTGRPRSAGTSPSEANKCRKKY